MISELILYVIDFLDSNLYNDISILEISSYFGYEKSYLMKKFKMEVGCSIVSYINQRKIYRSLGLLKDDELVLKIALESGYNSLEYYSEMFMKVTGVSPTIFRRYLRNKEEASLKDLEIIRNYLEMNRLLIEKIGFSRETIEHSKQRILRLSLEHEKKCA